MTELEGKKLTVRDTETGIDQPEEKEIKQVDKYGDEIVITV